MVNAAKDKIQKAVNNYHYQDFFKNREKISNEISRSIHGVFKDKFYSEVLFLIKKKNLFKFIQKKLNYFQSINLNKVPLFLLREVSLEKQFEESLIKNVVNDRETLTAKKQQEIEV